MNLNNLKNNPQQFIKNFNNISIIEDTINKANEAYFNGEPIISDAIYDMLIDKLKNLDSKNHLINQVGIKNDNNKVALPYYMGSMNKIKTLKEVKTWINRFKGKKEEFIISEKLDGISVLLIRKNTKTKLFTRGDGTNGRDISFLLDYIEPLKNKIQDKNISMRGEIIISHSNFNEYRKNPKNIVYSSARSMVNGLISLKESKSLLNILDIVFYEVIEPQLTPIGQFEWLQQNGYNYAETKQCTLADILNWNGDKNSYLHSCLSSMKKNSKYEIDGIIITHNNIYERKNENPKHSVAFKSNDIGKITTVKKIIWEPSKYNTIIPKIYFEKINLCSSKVEYCTGFNAKYIHENKLGPGSKIRVVLSGEVIPYICDIIQSTGAQFPDCQYKWCESKIHIISLEESIQNKIKRIGHFIKTLKIENLGEGIIEKLISYGFDTIPKILKITKKDLLECDGIKETLANKIYTNIHLSTDKPIYLGVLMVASLEFNSGFGIKKIEKILSKYSDILQKKYSVEDLNKIEGIQTATAKQFLDNLENFKEFLKTINFVKFFTSNSKTENNSNSDIKSESILTNKKIVLTGFRDNQLINYIEENGGIIQSSLNSKTDFLIIKDDSFYSSKVEKAKTLEKKILTKDQLLELKF